MIKQQLIVITLRDRLFVESKSILKAELKSGWVIKETQLAVGMRGRRGFMSVLLERDVPDEQDYQVYIEPPEYDPDDVAFPEGFDPLGLGDFEIDYTDEEDN